MSNVRELMTAQTFADNKQFVADALEFLLERAEAKTEDFSLQFRDSFNEDKTWKLDYVASVTWEASTSCAWEISDSVEENDLSLDYDYS